MAFKLLQLDMKVLVISDTPARNSCYQSEPTVMLERFSKTTWLGAKPDREGRPNQKYLRQAPLSLTPSEKLLFPLIADASVISFQITEVIKEVNKTYISNSIKKITLVNIVKILYMP